MGVVMIEVPEQIDIKIKADNFSDALVKLKGLEEHSSISKLNSIQKFKGIGLSPDYSIDKEDWYKQ